MSCPSKPQHVAWWDPLPKNILYNVINTQAALRWPWKILNQFFNLPEIVKLSVTSKSSVPGFWHHQLRLVYGWLVDLTVVMVLLNTNCCLDVRTANRLLRFTLWTSRGSTHTTMTGCCTTSRFPPVTMMTRPPLRKEVVPILGHCIIGSYHDYWSLIMIFLTRKSFRLVWPLWWQGRQGNGR